MCVRPQSGPLEWPVFPLIVGPNMLHAPRLVHRDNVFSVLTHHFLRKKHDNIDCFQGLAIRVASSYSTVITDYSLGVATTKERLLFSRSYSQVF